MVLVNLTAATICFLGQCYPALIGKDTIPGEYELTVRLTEQPGYGGSVLQFDENEKAWFAIHPLWLLKPSEHREQRIHSKDPKERVITHGCINVEPEVYQKLKNCCSNDHLSIVP